MKEKIRIAIDGPGGAGKSTIAKKVAEALNIDYIDTGAMYRAVAYKMLEKGIGLNEPALLSEMLSHTDIDFTCGNIVLDGEVINDKIRTPEVSKMASECSAFAEVREKLVTLQRKMGQAKSIVMDGRDIGTNVLIDAEYKIYMTASKEERARRRHAELIAKGQEADYEQVLSDIAQRDLNDMTRALNPLKKADDAIELDTTHLSIEEVTGKILKIVYSRFHQIEDLGNP